MQTIITFGAAFDLHIQDKVMNNLSPDTIHNARQICDWLLKKYETTQVNPAPFKAALLQFRERDIKPSTLSLYYRTLANFAKFCAAEGYCDPVNIPSLPEPAPTIAHLTPQQVSVILSSFDLSKFTGLRNNAIVRLLFDSGIRRGELLGIDIDNIFWPRNMFKIYGKGRREDFAHMCVNTKRHLWNYEKQARPRRNSAAFFITHGGERLTKNGLRMVFQRLPQFDGIRLSPHTLRHSFAVNSLLAGMDVMSLSQIMRHKSLDMTRRYAQLGSGERQSQHAKFTPGRKV